MTHSSVASHEKHRLLSFPPVSGIDLFRGDVGLDEAMVCVEMIICVYTSNISPYCLRPGNQMNHRGSIPSMMDVSMGPTLSLMHVQVTLGPSVLHL